MNSQNYKTKRTEFCIETMDLEFLRIKVDLNQKKLKSRFNKFQENKLKIIIQCNLKVVHYLNVNFNLTDSYCCPFSKINNEINYFDNRSNHHLFIIKQLLYLTKDIYATYLEMRKSSATLSPHTRNYE